MQRLLILAALLALFAPRPARAAEAQTQPSAEELQQQIEEVRQTLEELEAHFKSTQAAQAKTVQGEKIKVSGYIQARFEDEENAASKFEIARARLKMTSDVTDRTKFTFQLDARTKDGKVDLRDAYFDYLSPDHKTWYVRAGQSKLPIMYEVLESSSVRLAPERTAVARALFVGERDVGIGVHCKPAGWKGASVDFGLVNGQGRNTGDKNGHKDVYARVLAPAGKGTAYVGFYDGLFTDGGATTVRSRLAVGTEQAWGPVAFRAEYLRGRNLGLDMAGWYGQVAVRPRQGPDTFFLRWDEYDEDLDVADTTFRRATFGWEHRLGAKTRTTLAYEVRGMDAGFANVAGDGLANPNETATAQFQVEY